MEFAESNGYELRHRASPWLGHSHLDVRRLYLWWTVANERRRDGPNDRRESSVDPRPVRGHSAGLPLHLSDYADWPEGGSGMEHRALDRAVYEAADPDSDGQRQHGHRHLVKLRHSIVHVHVGATGDVHAHVIVRVRE